jgi:tRNA(fMet)-specific endonuclease VapC
MTGNKLLLDTNIVIDLFQGDEKISAYLDKQTIVYISVIVLSELYLGAYRSANASKHLKKIGEFLQRCELLLVDAETADKCAVIKTALLKKGKPIPENDIWIAASAMQHELKLLTHDKHFKEVSGIDIRYW